MLQLCTEEFDPYATDTWKQGTKENRVVEEDETQIEEDLVAEVETGPFILNLVIWRRIQEPNGTLEVWSLGDDKPVWFI